MIVVGRLRRRPRADLERRPYMLQRGPSKETIAAGAQPGVKPTLRSWYFATVLGFLAEWQQTGRVIVGHHSETTARGP